jgi:hypothetical protein
VNPPTWLARKKKILSFLFPNISWNFLTNFLNIPEILPSYICFSSLLNKIFHIRLAGAFTGVIPDVLI